MFLDPELLSTFVERWHADISNFHMICGEMVTLDDVRCLLHLPIQEGRLLDHKGIPSKTDGVEMMMELIGSTGNEA
jgi:hypothetical protein